MFLQRGVEVKILGRSKVIKKAVLLLLCLLVASVACSKQDPVFYDTQGHEVQLSKLKGEWIVVNFWADWCPSCLREIPDLNKFYAHTRNTNIIFFSVNYDGLTDRDLKNSIAKAGVNYPVLTENPSEAWGLGIVEALPTTFILDPQGQVVKKLVGANTESLLTDFFVESSVKQKK